jgi:cAMP phosphodiesterase
MKIRVLGCYETTSFLVNHSPLLDAGCVTSVLTIEEQDKIKHILITHSHLDHTGDIPILIDNTIEGRSSPINLIGTEKTLGQIKSHSFNDIVWPDLTRIAGENCSFLKFTPINPGEDFLLDGLTIRATEVNHVVETVGYFIKDNDISILYVGDTGPTSKIWEEANRLSNLKAVFIETALPNRLVDFAHSSGHLVPSTLKAELQKLRIPNIPVFIFHLKPRYLEAIRKEIEEIKNPNITILKPGDSFEF